MLHHPYNHKVNPKKNGFYLCLVGHSLSFPPEVLYVFLQLNLLLNTARINVSVKIERFWKAELG